MAEIMPVHKLLKQNQTVFNAQLAKLKSEIEMYEGKIKKQRKDNAKHMKWRAAIEKVPLKCQKITCPFEEKPICAKFFHRDGKRQPFYVTVINECEMKYLKCRKGLEAKIAAKENCHSILDTFLNPEAVLETTREHKRPQARRVKRDINKDASMKEKMNDTSSAISVRQVMVDKEPNHLKVADMSDKSKYAKTDDVSDKPKNSAPTQNTQQLRIENGKSQNKHTTKNQAFPLARKSAQENAENPYHGMALNEDVSHLNDELPYDPNNPLVEEPDVSDPKLNDDSYEFVPEDNEIVALSADEDEEENHDSHEVDQNVHDPKNPLVEDPDVRDPKPTDDKHEFVPGDNEIVEMTEDDVDHEHSHNDDYYDEEGLNIPGDGDHSDDTSVDKEEMNAVCPTKCPGQHSMVCAKCAHGVYRTFLSICHMRMYACRGPHRGEQLELVSHRACVMSAPVITNDPSMRPVGHLSLPSDKDSVLLYVRCRERGMLGRSPKCKGPIIQEIEVNAAASAPLEY